MDTRVIDFAAAKGRFSKRPKRTQSAKAAREILVQRQEEYLNQMIETDYLQLKEEQPGVLHSSDSIVRIMRRRAETRVNAILREYFILLKTKVAEIEKRRTDE